MPPEERPTELRPSSPGVTTVKAATALEDGRLGVLLRTAAVNWREDVVRYDPDGSTEPGYPQRRYDTLVDVIDVATGSMLSRTRLSGDVNLMSDGTLYRTLVSPEGLISVEAFDFEFVDQRAR